MLAFDFGASSGRAILGILEDDKLKTQEIHRFSNDPVEANGSFYWDVLRLFHEIKQGILKCINSGHNDISSIAVDTWGVDFGLLDENGDLIGNSYHYRDKRTNGMMEKVFEIIPKDELYNETGLEFMWFNTIFQLFSLKCNNSPQLREGKTLLLMPDLFNYLLTGEKKTEYSIASTTQLLDAGKRCWSDNILNKLGINKELFTEIVPSGTIIGKLSKKIAEELGCKAIPVAAVAGHDTQSAIASIPTEEKNFVYISCGTWSLMGVESEKPIINEKTTKLAFTNEGGVENKTTLLKNIMGLWLIQESRRQWQREGEDFSFAQLEDLAWEAKPFQSYIDSSDDLFAAPGDMPERIKKYCRKTNQPIPGSKGEIVRCIAESLALKYRATVEDLEDITARELTSINMIGGGIKDKMLCQFTANATGKKVIAGPVEATSIGNLMIQAMALGKVRDLKEIRTIVKNSYPCKMYFPQDIEEWENAYENFKKIIKSI